MNKGKFITFEGNDGCGKTTISNRVYNQLLEDGYDVIFTREPGGIDIAEQIREVILNPENTAMDARCEALLYAAARRQHLIEKVLPALADGKIVICDRFIDSSLAYQGAARGLGMDEIYQINEFAIDGNMPYATILLRVDAETGLKRIASRKDKDRLDVEGEKFHKLVAQGYDEVAKRYPQRIHVIDATLDEDEVFKNTYMLVKELVE
ncbi:dTMP kinase [Breznakia sp. PF5-3]|uniref:dTMP kinase n=1 Tax=unclassified Breznakia TaxID=2623764 RepID=UPI002405D10A|nr:MULTISPECIES: dTMP kinase [unclassified Breznakia]MDF9825102.1 dTMP kinase [Breznakia sp. PM6-1]MDF9835921.1 dTMP kinase [Breznakia sp. PF5-3]MDF9837477.1 dTMP kinase [Breznakia sp. PFB2-8]MDF9859460.1 dTMP kinase [Breznakia sp. PH5-24]